jgi:hypothetical protein
MHGNTARKYDFEMELSAPHPPAQVIRLYSATPQDARTHSDSRPAKERLVVSALITATLALGGTLFFSLYEGLRHYVVF